MSYNGSGQFVLVAGNPFVTGTTISSTTMNNTMSDIATGLSTAVTKDGQTTPTANIPLGGFKLTGLGAATVAGDALRFENIALIGSSIQNQTYVAFTTGGTSTAYTLTPTPAITAYTAGQSFFVTFNAASGAAPTLSISAVATPPNLVKQNRDGTYSNINAGDIPINHRSQVTLLSATQAWVEILPVSGVVVDRAYVEYTANASLTTIIPTDDTIPQNTEGTQIISVAYTPKSATNRLRLRFQGQFANSASGGGAAAIFSSASANALAVSVTTQVAADIALPLVVEHEYVPGVTTALTFSVRAGPGSAITMRFNGSASARLFGGASKATLVIEEITP